VDAALEREEVARVRAFRKRRPARVATRALTAVREAAALEVNLVPVILDAVKAKATLGEIAGAMREIFGAYRARSEV
jgi:methylmalonyl-CoA mutase N-terminal domain/subunit